ncbi:MAG: cytidine deaminase [Blautia sp.]|nr:cytidine deaminase [Blautia sp.]
MDKSELLKLAFDAQKRSYAPYSDFQVGAALLCKDGTVYQGCNIENASLGATNCAERTAIFKAVYDGKREFQAIAVVGKKNSETEFELCAPCGICRQVMAEFCDPGTFEIILGKNTEDYRVFTLEEILPLSFTGKDLAD